MRARKKIFLEIKDDNSAKAFEQDYITEGYKSNRLKLSNFPYFCLSDVENIYIYLNNGFKGLTSFLEKAEQLAVKKDGRFEFRNEKALFELLREVFEEQFKALKIKSWDELINYIS